MARIELFVLVSLIAIVEYSNTVSNYGPFNLNMTKVTICNGPKRKDCSLNTGEIINGTTIVYNMNVTEDIKNVRGTIVAIPESKQAVRLQLNKLCDHPFWLPFMRKYVNITKDCVIVKGYYKMVANAEEVARKYYGGSFLYGKWVFKSVMYTNTCNFGCSSIDIVLTPKH